MNIGVLPMLTKEQAVAICNARRELPIPTLAKASSDARGLFFKRPKGHDQAIKATNEATKICRRLGLSPHQIITLQVASEELVIGEALKGTIKDDDYQLLTFAFRSVLDPKGVSGKLRDHLTRLKLPDEPKQPAAQPGKAAAGPSRNGRGSAPAKASQATTGKPAGRKVTADDIRRLVEG